MYCIGREQCSMVLTPGNRDCNVFHVQDITYKSGVHSEVDQVIAVVNSHLQDVILTLNDIDCDALHVQRTM